MEWCFILPVLFFAARNAKGQNLTDSTPTDAAQTSERPVATTDSAISTASPTTLRTTTLAQSTTERFIHPADDVYQNIIDKIASLESLIGRQRKEAEVFKVEMKKQIQVIKLFTSFHTYMYEYLIYSM